MMKKVACAVLCVLLAVSLFGCGGGSGGGKGINLRDRLADLATTDEALGLKGGKYQTLSDIAEGGADVDLIGTWKTADEKTAYTYGKDCTVKVTSEYGDSEARFVCFTAENHKVLCEEVKMTSSDTEGNTTESTVLSFSTYKVENDALFFANVEDTTDENINSSYYAVIVMYRADENGSIDASLAKNKLSLDTFNGTWSSEKGEFTVKNGTLTLDGETFKLSVDEKNQLVAEKDGKATAYSANISLRKQYESADRSSAEETTAMAISYTGADENDKPNLLKVLDDWKTDYQWDTYYYSGSFNLKK